MIEILWSEHRGVLDNEADSGATVITSYKIRVIIVILYCSSIRSPFINQLLLLLLLVIIVTYGGRRPINGRFEDFFFFSSFRDRHPSRAMPF